MEIKLNFSRIDDFDNLKDLKELNCIKIYDIPYNITILDKEETYSKLDLKNKKFKKISKKEKREYLYKIFKKLFEEKLKSCIFDEYLCFLETNLNEKDRIYFIYNEKYLDFFNEKAYIKKNKQLIEYENFNFSTINYEDIKSIFFISNQKITDIVRDFGGKEFRKYSREGLIESYIEDSFAISGFFDCYLEEAFEFYDDEMFTDWLNHVSYNDFIKKTKEEYDE